MLLYSFILRIFKIWMLNDFVADETSSTQSAEWPERHHAFLMPNELLELVPLRENHQKLLYWLSPSKEPLPRQCHVFTPYCPVTYLQVFKQGKVHNQIKKVKAIFTFSYAKDIWESTVNCEDIHLQLGQISRFQPWTRRHTGTDVGFICNVYGVYESIGEQQMVPMSHFTFYAVANSSSNNGIMWTSVK
jgi:hypothetical protein